jgi:hypothetical protein
MRFVRMSFLVSVALGACSEPDCLSVCDDLYECSSSDCEPECERLEKLTENAGCNAQLSAHVRCLDDADDACSSLSEDGSGECMRGQESFQQCLDSFCSETEHAELCSCGDLSCTGSISPL